MAIEVGAIIKGKVTRILNFGAFVELENGKTGMVHISEVASEYVKEISNYLSIGQEIDVKIIKIGEDGKISLSVKQAAAPVRPNNLSYQRPVQKNNSFDDMLSKFMQTSNEKNSENNAGGRNERRNSSRKSR